ncbi:unnamed protein product [Ectocarpus sp. 6 AP-2014]
MPEFTGVGKHCEAENCNQQDFLPFECDCCNGTFCLSHRSYAAHSCAASGNKDFRALVCPLCKKTVRFNGGQDPNQQWDLHTRTDCNPEDYKRNKQTKKRCAAASCRVVLGPTNTQRCASCGKETCLTHRFPDSHSCSASSRGDARGSAAAAAARRMAAQANQSRPMSLREKAAQNRAAASSRRDANANTARATADRRRRENPAAQARSFGGSGGQSEQCPQCGATFGDIGSLVAHVEAFHSEGQQFRAHGGGGGGGSSSSGETCPICNLHFADVALLVSHVEAVHPDGAREGSSSQGAMSSGASSCSIC